MTLFISSTTFAALTPNETPAPAAERVYGEIYDAVVDHRLPPGMRLREEELAHGAQAVALGARPLPEPVRCLMKVGAKAMTGSTYWV